MARTGIVVIGRNEGARLRASLVSALRPGAPVVYVDSGSVDGSPRLAAAMGCDVLELDPSTAFSAARARNEGFRRLIERDPAVSHVQFVDGDCELVDGWIARATAELECRPDVALVCGHVRERNPEANVYHRLGDLEWRRTPGDVRACGGNFMIRADAFRVAGGFRPDVIAAEDDEFCYRLRRSGGRLFHVDAEMVVHDMAMNRFGQWWRRARRSGHAYAHVAALHGGGDERYFVRDCRRIWFWAFCLPLAAGMLAVPTAGISLSLLGGYPLQAVRVFRRCRRRGWPARDAWLYGAFTTFEKFPAWTGLLAYHWRSWRGAGMTIIEHKRGTSP